MNFSYANDILENFPERITGTLCLDGLTAQPDFTPAIERFNAVAEKRLLISSESDWPEIQAWRQIFSRMDLKPTQYRCAAEALLRRFRKEKSLPRLHPLIDLCNALSLAFAIPIAVFDRSRISDGLIVRYATGDECYQTFSGDIEQPKPGEVIFADQAGIAHARRWTNRQSGYSAVRQDSADILIVAEAVHANAARDIPHLMAALRDELSKARLAASAIEIIT